MKKNAPEILKNLIQILQFKHIKYCCLLIFFCQSGFGYSEKNHFEICLPGYTLSVPINPADINVNLASCTFLITKAICNSDNSFTICAEANDPTCPNNWVLKQGNTVLFTTTDAKFCFTTLPNTVNDFILYHYCGPNDFCSKDISVICNPDCSVYNFKYSSSNCEATFDIENLDNHEVVFSFGDGSHSESTNGSSINHIFSKCGGTFNVCLTSEVPKSLTNQEKELTNASDPPGYYTCCYNVVIPNCISCKNPSITWEQCPVKIANECCINLTFHSDFTSSTTYKWDIYLGNNLIHTETTTNKNLQHHFIGKGPYFICVTFTVDDCERQCCDEIELPPCDCCESADFTFQTKEVSIYNTCLNRIFEINPVCSRIGMTRHKWIFSDGVVIWRDAIDPAPPDHIFTNYVNTTGEVCVTHEIYCDDQLQATVTKCKSMSPGAYLGVTGQVIRMSDILVNLNPNITVFGFITQYANNPAVPLLIDGILTNDINTSFNNGYWWMAKGSQVYINANTSFGLSGTEIRTAARIGFVFCCRWKGIKAEPRSTLTWNGATISDAEIMLETVNSSPAGARLNFTNNNFLENVMGIKSINHRFTCGSFHNNRFTGCKECNVLCGCSQSPCIYIDMTGGTTLPIVFPVTGAKNSISSYDQGFEVYNLNLNVKNFDIFNITQHGIYYDKSISSNRSLTLDLMTFDNMRTGVVDNSSGGGTHILNAVASVPFNSLKFTNVWQGYNIGIVRTLLNGNISNNEINTNGGVTNLGISVGLVGSANNNFTANNNRLIINGGTVNSVGISLSSTTNYVQNGVISNNNIQNAAVNMGAGIFINNWVNTRVTDNIINISNDKAGIELTNGGQSLIKCNSINSGRRGMSFSISPENNIVSNSCYGNFNSIFFTGNCAGRTKSFIGKNNFSNSVTYSTLYATDANTGIQNHYLYNSWTPVVLQNKVLHNGGAKAAIQCQITSPANVNYPSVHYPRANPNNMFIATGPPPGLQSSDCLFGGTSGDGNYSDFHRTSSEAGEQYNQILGQGDYFDNFTAAQTTSTLQSIFELILINPDWLSQYSNLATFYNSNLSTFIGISAQVKHDLEMHLSAVEAQNQSLSTLYNQQQGLENQLASLDLLLLNESDPVQIQLLLNQMQVVQQQIEVVSQSIADQMNINNSINLMSLNSIQNLNEILVALLPHEINEKNINRITIKLLKGEGITTSESSILRSVAQTCYAEGGRTVYNAIDLCIYLFKEYYSQVDCPLSAVGEKLETRIQTSKSLKLIPNPAISEVSILLPNSFKDKDALGFYLMDNLGREYRLVVSKINDLNYVAELGFFNEGVYILVVKSGESTETTKIIISK